MAALWGLMVIAFAILSKFIGVTVSPLRWENLNGLISREQDPDSFRKAVGVQIVIGLLFIVGWFSNHYWHVFE
jgi:hypothetical protein